MPLRQEVVDESSMPLPVEGFTNMFSELFFNQPRITAVPVIRLLSANEIEMCEPAREIHRRLEHVIRIRNQSSEIPAFKQDFSDCILFGWYLMPTRRMMPMSTPVEIVFPRKTPHPREVAAPDLKRRLSLTKGACEPDRL